MTPGASGIPWQAIAALAVSLALAFIPVGLLHASARRRMRALERGYRASFEIMSRLIDAMERYADHHSRRVAESSVEIASALGATASEIEDIRIGALLHGIGRLDLPAEALARAGGFAPEEMDDSGRLAGWAMTSAGGPRVSHDAGGTLRRVLPLVTCLEERWDGTGRKALRGREIPLGARIIAVANAYDELVTDRAYRRGLRPEAALEALEEASARQFDPQVVETFMRLHRAGAPAVEAVAA